MKTACVRLHIHLSIWNKFTLVTRIVLVHGIIVICQLLQAVIDGITDITNVLIFVHTCVFSSLHINRYVTRWTDSLCHFRFSFVVDLYWHLSQVSLWTELMWQVIASSISHEKSHTLQLYLSLVLSRTWSATFSSGLYHLVVRCRYWHFPCLLHPSYFLVQYLQSRVCFLTTLCLAGFIFEKILTNNLGMEEVTAEAAFPDRFGNSVRLNWF